MRLLLLWLLLVSASRADSILTAQITSGQIFYENPPFSFINSSFQTPGHTIVGNADVDESCVFCSLEELRAQGTILAGVLWIYVDGTEYKSGSGILFKESWNIRRVSVSTTGIPNKLQRQGSKDRVVAFSTELRRHLLCIRYADRRKEISGVAGTAFLT